MEQKELYDRLRCGYESPDFELYGVPDQAQKVFFEAMGRFIYGDAHGFWMPPDSNDGHCQPEKLIETLADRMSCFQNHFDGGKITSPIEAMLIGALVWIQVDWAGYPDWDYLGGGHSEHLRVHGPVDGLRFIITSQAPVGSYKADFLAWFSHGKHHAGVVIECDGHEFHERTKEQAGRDKKRDREIVGHGYPVLRFTGTEIFKDPMGCAAQVRDVLIPVLQRLSKDAGLI